MNRRQLFVDFALHTDHDVAFKKELITHMLRDLQELKHALDHSMELCDMSHYRSICHKVNSTITLLADEEFKNIVQEIKVSSEHRDLVMQFNDVYSQLVKSLEMERDQN